MSSFSVTSVNFLSTTLKSSLSAASSSLSATNTGDNTATTKSTNAATQTKSAAASADKFTPTNKGEQKLVNAAKAYIETAHLVSVLDGFKDLLSVGLPGKKNNRSVNSQNFFTSLNQLQSLTSPYSNKGNDLITSYYGGNINAGDGNDIVTSHQSASINGGKGNDILTSYGSLSDINAGEGNDIIRSYGHSTINGGAGNDSITSFNGGKIEAGAGNDLITSYGFAQISGGQGDDTVTISGTGATYHYNKGDGSDTITTSSSITLNLEGFASDDISISEEKGRTIISFKNTAETLTLNLLGTATARLNFALGNPITV